MSSALFAATIGILGLSEVDALTYEKIMKFWPAVVAQLMTIFSGMKVRQSWSLPLFLFFLFLPLTKLALFLVLSLVLAEGIQLICMAFSSNRLCNTATLKLLSSSEHR